MKPASENMGVRVSCCVRCEDEQQERYHRGVQRGSGGRGP